MKLLIAKAHEQRPMAEEMNVSLSALGFDVFCDQTGLKTEGVRTILTPLKNEYPGLQGGPQILQEHFQEVRCTCGGIRKAEGGRIRLELVAPCHLYQDFHT